MKKRKRMSALLLALALAFSLTACGQAQPNAPEEEPEETPIEAEVTAASFAEEFVSPPAENRPLTRWWVPGALMTKEEIKAEIESMSAAGFGGTEVVPVAVAGAEMANGEDAEAVGGTVTLAGVTAAKYADKDNKVLAFDSAKALDLSEVSSNADGAQTVSFTPDDDGDYVLFAWYQHLSGNQKFGNNQVAFNRCDARMRKILALVRKWVGGSFQPLKSVL